MPCLTHLHNGGITLRHHGYNKKNLNEFRIDFIKKMSASYGHDQPEAVELYDTLLTKVIEEVAT